MHIEVVTLFPALVQDALRHGVLGRAIERGLLRVGTVDPRDFSHDAHRTVDDRPYGGGPGMVLKPEPLCAAIDDAVARAPAGSLRVALSAQGRLLTQACVGQWAQRDGLVLVAGRYEGIDERVLDLSIDLQISIGDYVLSGGEMPALVVIDALARLLPGALGDVRSNLEESFESGLLDWPHYTRPEVYQGRGVPEVLRSGDHAAIRRWRVKQSVGRTWLRRPELIDKAPLDGERAGLLEEYLREQAAGCQELRSKRR